MTGDCHVRICEGRGVRLPPATRPPPPMLSGRSSYCSQPPESNSRHLSRIVPVTRSQVELTRAPDGALQDPHAVASKEGVEGTGELGVAIADEEGRRTQV